MPVKLLSLIVVMCMALLTGCNGEKDEGSAKLDANSPEGKGQKTFQTYCATCHAVTGDRVIVGPSLAGIAKHAETRSEGLTASEYLEESIISPNSYIVENFQSSTMPQNFGRDLTSEQIDQVIAYLLTLE